MIVTVIGVLAETQDDAHLKRGMRKALPHLMRLWTQTHPDAQPSKVFFLAYSPGHYSPAEAGPVRDLMPEVPSGARVSFSMTSDPEAAQSPFCLWDAYTPNWA